MADEGNGSWGSAQEVPGTASLNTGGAAAVTSVSCPSAGDCTAGGYYSNGGSQAFVVDQVNGTWGSAQEVPGTGALNAGGTAYVGSVSCASAGNCAAGGYYRDASGHLQAFVVDELNGTWGNAQEVPGTATLNIGKAYVSSLSCPTAGNCAAGGYYEDSSRHYQAFVANEVSGSWGNAREVPGTAKLNTDGSGYVSSVSCVSAGNCAAGGYYKDGSGHFQAFVVNEVNGGWGNAQRVPGTASLNLGGNASVSSVSCVPPGDCAAGGSYKASGAYEAFVVNSPVPSVSGLAPDQGPRSGGTMVTITGRNLLTPTAVHFGATAARIHKVLSASKLEVISPPGAGTVAVTVTTAGGTSVRTTADHFTYRRG